MELHRMTFEDVPPSKIGMEPQIVVKQICAATRLRPAKVVRIFQSHNRYINRNKHDNAGQRRDGRQAVPRDAPKAFHGHHLTADGRILGTNLKLAEALLPLIGIVFFYALIRLAVKDGMKDAWRDREKKGRRP